jgi:serine/threonine-protein kinase
MNQENSFVTGSTDHTRFARVQTLFSNALKLAEDKRFSFLESACGDDSVVLAEVLGMLKADEKGTPLLDEGIANVAHQVLGPGRDIDLTQVGPYHLQRKLGEGGMGVVYLAERADFGNPVAVKFLRDAGLSPARQERFLSEQRLLAPLNHPSIARFYDAGTDQSGMPWFAMEYVEGVPVTEYCRARASSVEERLRLFCAICEAVQYAHEHAVIHRDLKPSNILVKEDGSVRLLDFGIAKQISDFNDPVDHTQTGLRMMTPAYAAPEQLRGEAVGIFTDEYALGVILYELLTGEPPFDFDGRTPGEAERIIAEDEPQKPSLMKPQLGLPLSRAEWADLDVICLTAIHKDSTRRYRSVDALMRDVNRYRSNEPVEARPDSAAYKLSKFVRRNRKPVFAATAAGLMLVVLVTFFLIRLTRARNEALAQAARSERIKDFMQHLFDNDAQSGPSVELRAVDVLDRGVRETQRLDSEPRTKGELLQMLGDLYEKLGKYDRAYSLLSSALAVRRSNFGNENKEVAETLVSLGTVRGAQGKVAEGLQLIRQALAVDSRLLKPDDFALGSARMALGRVLVTGGDYKEAINTLAVAVQALSKPGAPQSDLFLALDGLGTAYTENGQFALAASTYQRALSLGRQIYKSSNPLISEEIVNLGSVEFSLQHFTAAENYYREGLEKTVSWYGPDHPLVASESRLLGQALLAQWRIPEAENYLRQALALHEKLSGGDLHGDGIQDLNALAIAAQRSGHLSEAESYLNRMLRIEATANGGGSAPEAIALNNLADVKRDQKQYASAEALSRTALLMIGKVLPADHLYAGVILLGLGRTLMKEKRFKEAEPYLIKSYVVLGKQGNPSLGTLQKARAALADDYTALGKSSEARKLEAEVKGASQK